MTQCAYSYWGTSYTYTNIDQFGWDNYSIKMIMCYQTTEREEFIFISRSRESFKNTMALS
jgi:hypothetical protein